jgi:hypothetical protein
MNTQARGVENHIWETLYPRGSWPVYRCVNCSALRYPTREELNANDAPTWFTEVCNGRS